MTETTQHVHQVWIGEFTNELQLRHVDDQQIKDAVLSVREHLADSGDDPRTAFGHARDYAASLSLPTRDEGFSRAGLLTAIILAVASFLTFGITVTRWVGGDDTLAVIFWTIVGATVLLAASVWLTVGIARHVVDAAIRERFSGTEAGKWSRWAPLAIAIPWTFPIFAAIVFTASVLRG